MCLSKVQSKLYERPHDVWIEAQAKWSRVNRMYVYVNETSNLQQPSLLLHYVEWRLLDFRQCENMADD